MIIELMAVFIMSLLNLLGLNNGITAIILFIFNIILFFILNYINAHKAKKRGLIEGIILGFILIVIIFIIKLLLFNNSINIATFLYYLILLVASLLGGMFGVNKKSET